MKVVEKFLCGKENNPDSCEDGIFIGEHVVAVIDGVTAKGKRLWNNMSSGCFAKELLLQYLENNSIENLSAEEVFRQLDMVIFSAVQDTGEEIEVEDYPRAVIIIYNDLYQEIWNYGDCQCRINDIVYSHRKEVDKINENLRAEVLEEYIKQGYTIEKLRINDVGRAAIQENLLNQFAYENQLGKWGYPVLNGCGIETSFIKRYSVKQGDSIILASDGYPNVEMSLKQSEAALSQILRDDPLCFRQFRATKGLKDGNASFDDRAFCKINV